MRKSFVLPPLGHRIIKTAVAVFICTLLHMVSGYRGSASSAAITAIICMQPYVTDSKTYAYERVLGTLMGSGWGLLCLWVLTSVPGLERFMPGAYLIIALFVLAAMYSTVVVKKATTASLVAIVLLGMVIDFPDMEFAFSDLLASIADTVVGTLVAVGVNVYHLPRRQMPEKLFFVRTMDITPDRFNRIPSSVHIILDHLYGDGAKICLISRWAPAFVIGQMGLLDVNVPMIVMDGAGLYDVGESKYLDVVDIPHENAARLEEIITGLGTFCSYYTVRDRSLCIYRVGPINDAEREEYRKMKGSPYRNYLDGSYGEEDKIAFMRVIDTPERIDVLAGEVCRLLPEGMFRMELRQEAQFPDYRGLYFYSPGATVENMKRRVTERMEKKYGMALERVDILPRGNSYSPEHDALILLSRIKKIYEPIDLKSILKRRKK